MALALGTVDLVSVGGCLLVSLVTLAAGLGRLPARWHRGRILGRVAKPIDPGALDASVGANVVLEGRLVDAGYTTTFPGAAHAVEEAHARAVTTSIPKDAAKAAIQVGDRVVALTAPLQVVLGSDEHTTKLARDVASVRVLSIGDHVRAVGNLARVAAHDGANEGGYRDRAVAYELHAAGDAMPAVVTLYAARDRARGVTTALLLLLPLPLFAFSLLQLAHLAHATSVTSSSPARDGLSVETPRSRCGLEIDRALEASDPWTARELATKCDDPQGLALASWRMGDMPAAAAAFATWRARVPLNPISTPEVESALLGDRPNAPRLVKQMQADWYRGPRDAIAVSFDCIVAGAAAPPTEGFEATERPMSWPCAAGPAEHIFQLARQGENTDHQPNYALHGPELYARFVSPLATEPMRWGSRFSDLGDASATVHETNALDRQLLHFAITGEAAKYTEVARTFDHLSQIYPSIDAAKIEPQDFVADEPVRQEDLEAERVEIRFAAQKALAVAAAAAFFAFDDARVQAYLPNGESHARAILEEELRIQQGKQDAPDAAHSPSDYWDGEMKLFADAASDNVDSVAEEAQKIDASPAVLAAIVGHRPELAPAIRRQMDRGYCSVRGEGLYALLQQAFRRRFAAHVTHDRTLEEKWLGVTQAIGASLRADGAFLPLDSLESLLAKPE